MRKLTHQNPNPKPLILIKVVLYKNFKIRRIIEYPEREEEGGGRERVENDLWGFDPNDLWGSTPVLLVPVLLTCILFKSL